LIWAAAPLKKKKKKKKTWEVLCYNLGRVIGQFGLAFSWFFFSISKNIPGERIDKAKIRFFQILSNPLFTDHPDIRRYIVRQMGSVVT
jgi:hypothetical protein